MAADQQEERITDILDKGPQLAATWGQNRGVVLLLTAMLTRRRKLPLLLGAIGTAVSAKIMGWI